MQLENAENEATGTSEIAMRSLNLHGQEEASEEPSEEPIEEVIEEAIEGPSHSTAPLSQPSTSTSGMFLYS